MSKASCYYLERAGLVETRRGPVAKAAPGLNRLHQYPLRPPLPLPTLLEAPDAPGAGLSTLWPHGAAGLTEAHD